MGCGSSGNVVPSTEEISNGQEKIANGTKTNHDHKDDKDQDELPTVVLPETPAKKPPIAFEIPLEELDSARKGVSTPPQHIQRLLHPPQPELTLPDIEGKLAEAESRRQLILQQRAASAQKRAQKMLRNLHEMDRLDSEHEHMEAPDPKHDSNTLKLPPEPVAWEDRNI